MTGPALTVARADPASAGACRLEAQSLRELTVQAKDYWGGRDDRWRELTRALERIERSEDLGSLNSEHALESVSLSLRSLCLSQAHTVADQHLKSPPLDASPVLPCATRW
jgi:hypothetical protein